MSKRENRRKIYRQMWLELRIDYLFITFAVALSTVSILQDIAAFLTSKNDLIALPFKYALAIAVTLGRAIMMKNE